MPWCSTSCARTRPRDCLTSPLESPKTRPATRAFLLLARSGLGGQQALGIGVELGQRVARGAHRERLFLGRQQQAGLQVRGKPARLDEETASLAGREQVQLA